MTRAALALLLTFALLYALGLVLFSSVARAGDNAGLPMDERGYVAFVHEAEIMNRAYWEGRGVDQTELLRAVFDGGSPTLPVPLPPTLPILTAAIAALIWKGKHA